jgi:putative transcriptional regulator
MKQVYHGSGGRTLNNKDDIAQLVRELRQRLGLSQEKFAAKLGVTFPTINRWENGRAKPSPLALGRIEELTRKLGKGGADLVKRFFPE